MIDWELAQAKKALFEVLGSTDPVAYHKAMKAALTHIEAAHVATRQKLEIEADYAKRGPYKESDDE